MSKFFSSIGDALPLWLKAILIGFFVSTLGVTLWVLNISLLPSPWPIIIMGIILISYWLFFSGTSWHDPSKPFRKTNFRATKLDPTIWKWGIIAAILFVIAVEFGLGLTFRFISFPAEAYKAEYNLDALPLSAAIPGIIMAALVAGICEEIGFRGYMQKPMEEKYGPIVSIIIVSIIFVVVHLHQAWAGPILFHIFFASVMFGLIAWSTDSLLPGIIAHVLLDIVNFSYWWSDIAGAYTYRPIGETGIDTHFVLMLVIVLISLALFFGVIWRIRTLKRPILSKIRS